MTQTQIDSYFLVVGGGVAGLYAALCAAEYGTVALVVKSPLSVSNSAWAQGGIAAAIAPDDSPQLHQEDTLRAGRDFCNRRAVEVLTREGPERVRHLLALGVPFERTGDQLDLGQEGGHSRRRILHAGGGATGGVITTALSRLVCNNPNIRLHESLSVVGLIAGSGICHGALARRNGNGSEFVCLRAPATILATGGAAGIFEPTTNPPSTTGDGMALAYLAGAELVDMEFIQFHPTALHSKAGRTLLISEALRGEGAHLEDAAGRRFMPDYHEQAELAPRDIVSWAIREEMLRSGSDCVFLNARHLDAGMLRERFAAISHACLQRGLDITKDRIPVSPAAHYTIGGVRTDIDGRTNIAGLWACGEVASTGVNGANRLASNSLLECLVFARRSAISASGATSPRTPAIIPEADSVTGVTKAPEDFQRLTKLVSTHLGLQRNGADLASAQEEVEELWKSHSEESAEWRNRLILARLILKAAVLREESRGVHRRKEFPRDDPGWLRRIAFRRGQEPYFLPV
jgi:L-aspartate oxidase